MLNDRENVEKALERFKKHVVTRAKYNLTQQNRNVSRKLYNSISGEYKVNQNSFELSFDMLEYGNYLDQGVKGAVSSAKAPNSPFRFGSGTGKKGGLTNGMKKWVRARKIRFRDRETNKVMTYDQTAFLITRSIYRKGMKPSLFFTKPFENAYKNLPNELVEKFGLDLDSLIDFTL